LRAQAQAPARDDDAAISIPADCNCGLCDELHQFLRSQQRTLQWPLAKDRRQHVHRVIEAAGLPVAHQTRRSGSPYVLVLTKDLDKLARLESAQRREAQAALAAMAGPTDEHGGRARSTRVRHK
jgi:hypothetical protein